MYIHVVYLFASDWPHVIDGNDLVIFAFVATSFAQLPPPLPLLVVANTSKVLQYRQQLVNNTQSYENQYLLTSVVVVMVRSHVKQTVSVVAVSQMPSATSHPLWRNLLGGRQERNSQEEDSRKAQKIT